ncbi:MAG: hypothetical protein PHZ04_03025 [Patescibacteria group bacterium]|nr:hypothetical protein [Patescibacteria group bacterium]MDD5294377.1 hypothetical protein [Patescibacteria group bacterium]MDD5554676.1 hypothetical protein [Patescibacteria group bacterium]
MEEDTEKPETDGQGNEPPTNPSSAEKLFWWNGEEMIFVGIMDL